jgi:hypothetical protein
MCARLRWIGDLQLHKTVPQLFLKKIKSTTLSVINMSVTYMTPPGWGLEHRASNSVSVKNLTAIETSTIVKLRPYVPVGTKRTSK